ncbi:MAG: ABC transporter permease [Brachybacterium sp.]|nr:ABC transporter permease [Brachybacterium sp.]
MSETAEAGQAVTSGAQAPPPPSTARGGDSSASLALQIARSNVLVVILAFILAFLIGSLLILVADEDVRASSAYFFARPGDTIAAGWSAITEAYAAMFRGAVYNTNADTVSAGLRPLTETLTVATPLIIASAGMAVGFRAGLFNIGGTGQLIVGAMAAGYVGFSMNLPAGIHLIAALVAGVVAGGIWGGIAGFLKAWRGANEVISTIMLNWIATWGLAFALTTVAFTSAASNQPISPPVAASAQIPTLIPGTRLHLGLLIALLSLVFLWWLMSRSTLGFRFRAVGSNPRAAEVAGIDAGRSAFGVMLTAGALVGLAGAVHILGTEHRLTGGIAGTVGFDAITVALLGRSGPVGILLAGLLFAGLTTGGRFMETTQGVPLDLVHVLQALVVLLIAAPPLVRALVGLRFVDRPRRPRRNRRNRSDTPGGRRSGGSTAAPATGEQA